MFLVPSSLSFQSILNPRIFPQSCILHSTVHTTVCAAHYLTRSKSTLTCLHANHRGASCTATGFRHNKPTYQPTIFLLRPRPPDYDRSIEEEIEEEREREDRKKEMTDERDVVVILRVSYIDILFSLFSSLVSCCP